MHQYVSAHCPLHEQDRSAGTQEDCVNIRSVRASEERILRIDWLLDDVEHLSPLRDTLRRSVIQGSRASNAAPRAPVICGLSGIHSSALSCFDK